MRKANCATDGLATGGAWTSESLAAGEVRLYTDGVRVAVPEPFATGDFSSPAAVVTIGWFTFSDIEFHHQGALDEVAVYDRALTDAEVADHRQLGLSGTARQPCTPCFNYK